MSLGDLKKRIAGPDDMLCLPGLSGRDKVMKEAAGDMQSFFLADYGKLTPVYGQVCGGELGEAIMMNIFETILFCQNHGAERTCCDRRFIYKKQKKVNFKWHDDMADGLCFWGLKKLFYSIGILEYLDKPFHVFFSIQTVEGQVADVGD